MHSGVIDGLSIGTRDCCQLSTMFDPVMALELVKSTAAHSALVLSWLVKL